VSEDIAPLAGGRTTLRHTLRASAEGNPEAHMQEYFLTYYEKLKCQLIERIHAQPPAFFEDLIIDLLLAMGYGRRRPDLAKALGRSGDGGIDGVVRQDSLGLDVVYVQAKRYRPGVAVETAAVRDFAGALDAHKADKGVFVTTSHYPKSAAKFIAASRRRIALIDGAMLTSLLIRHSVAVRPHLTYELKHLDEDYFAGKREDGEARRA
jgi:restriction system protein